MKQQKAAIGDNFVQRKVEKRTNKHVSLLFKTIEVDCDTGAKYVYETIVEEHRKKNYVPFCILPWQTYFPDLPCGCTVLGKGVSITWNTFSRNAYILSTGKLECLGCGKDYSYEIYNVTPPPVYDEDNPVISSVIGFDNIFNKCVRFFISGVTQIVCLITGYVILLLGDNTLAALGWVIGFEYIKKWFFEACSAVHELYDKMWNKYFSI